MRPAAVEIESLSAITLTTRAMARAVEFYEALGFERLYGGTDADFTSFRVGTGYLNLASGPDSGATAARWGRAIFYVSDVDAMHDRALAAGLRPEFAPRDARWGERYFHLRDPDGHELSFARPLEPRAAGLPTHAEAIKSGSKPSDAASEGGPHDGAESGD